MTANAKQKIERETVKKNNAEERAEAFYLEVFGVIAANGDFVEPEEGFDFLLAEAFLASLSATIITAILQSLFKKLEQSFEEKLHRRPFRGSELIEAEPETLIAELSKGMRTRTLDAGSLAQVHREVKNTLRGLGIAEDISSRIADELLTVVERHHNAL